MAGDILEFYRYQYLFKNAQVVLLSICIIHVQHHMATHFIMKQKGWEMQIMVHKICKLAATEQDIKRRNASLKLQIKR